MMESRSDQKRISAEQFLGRYQKALAVYEYLIAEKEFLLQRAENVRSSSNIASGWTGRYVTETIQGKEKDHTGEGYKNSQKRTVQAKEMVVLPGHTAGNNDGQEFAMMALLDHDKKIDEAGKRLNQVKKDIETVVNTALPLTDALIIQRKYILGQSINEIAKAMYCSPSTISRRIKLSLEYLDESLFSLVLPKNG